MLKPISQALYEAGITSYADIIWHGQTEIPFLIDSWKGPGAVYGQPPGSFISSIIEYFFRRRLNHHCVPCGSRYLNCFLTASNFFEPNPHFRQLTIWELLPVEDLDDKTLIEFLIEDHAREEKEMLEVFMFNPKGIMIPVRYYHVDSHERPS
jgi:hypothetical protein